MYWNTPNAILRSSGQSPTPPETFTTQAPGVTELAADETALYWAGADGKLRTLRFDQPGGTPVILDTELKSPRAITVDAKYVYRASALTGEVAAVPKSGGARIVIATGKPAPDSIVALNTAVFFINRSAGTLLRVPKQ